MSKTIRAILISTILLTGSTFAACMNQDIVPAPQNSLSASANDSSSTILLQEDDEKYDSLHAPATSSNNETQGSLTEDGESSDLSVSIRGTQYTYQDDIVVTVNNNVPFFDDDDFERISEKQFSELDNLGRCGLAAMIVSSDTLPKEERGNIGMIKPSGWHQNKYPGIINENPPMLMNRGHLLAWMLSGENANEKNLISMTRACNLAMIPYETEVASYADQEDHSVLYRVTPFFENDNLFATGVLMEAQSLKSDDIRFCVFVYNVQPGVVIDYKTGENYAEGKEIRDSDPSQEDAIIQTYILNTNSKKYHLPDCESVSEMKSRNKKKFEGTRRDLEKRGYDPCGRCIK